MEVGGVLLAIRMHLHVLCVSCNEAAAATLLLFSFQSKVESYVIA